MKKVFFTICGIFIAGTVSAANESCVKTTFDVKYSCGDGTLVGTLPADTAVNYNASFKPETITTDMCTPPVGFDIGGYAVYVDGVEMAFSLSFAASFMYSYVADIEIQPKYIPNNSAVATPTALAMNLGVGSNTYTYDKTSLTWTVTFPYGMVSGIAKCSDVTPANTAGFNAALIVGNQDEIENDTVAGRYCYCKMTGPDIAGSPWVYNVDNSTSKGCLPNCANNCGYRVRNNAQFRASIYAAAFMK